MVCGHSHSLFPLGYSHREEAAERQNVKKEEEKEKRKRKRKKTDDVLVSD